MEFGNGYIKFSGSIDVRVIVKRKKGPARVYLAWSGNDDEEDIQFISVSDSDFDADGQCEIALPSIDRSGWLDWSFLATAAGTKCFIQVLDDKDKLRYARERPYSGSGIPPFGTIRFVEQ